MKQDTLTKLLLSVIAMALCIIAFNPTSPASAQSQAPGGKYSNVTFTGAPGGFYMFDHTTGGIFLCENPHMGGILTFIGKLDGPNRALVR